MLKLDLQKRGARAPSRKSACVFNRSAQSAVEALECRTLLSASLSGTTLNVTGTSAADTFTLSDNGTTITVLQGSTTFAFADSKVSKIVVNPSAGGDTVNLLSNTKPVTITGGGLDTVNIGDNGSLLKIAAAVSVSNSSSFTSLSLDGSADAPLGLAHVATLTGTSIAGYSTGTITYTAGQLSALSISDDNDLTVAGTGSLHGNAPTVVNGGGTVTVLATSGPLTINADNLGGLNIGQGATQAITGTVIFNVDAEVGAVLNVDDSADTVGRNVTIDGNLNITGLAPATISFANALNDSNLIYNAGSGNDTLTIEGGASDGTNVYNMGPGDDTVNLYAGSIITEINGDAGNDALTVGNGNGPDNIVDFDGGTGVNSMTLNDSQDISGAPYRVDGTSIGYLDDGQVNGTNVQSMAVYGGVADSTFTASPSTNVPLLIQGGPGNDSIIGGGGNETLLGGAGNDTIIAGTGNDSLNGGPGTDSLVGGTGIDTIDNGDGDGSPVQIIADNLASAPVSSSQGVTLTGNWISSTSTPGFYATNYINDNNSLKGTKSVTWTPNIPFAGSYQVYARWPAAASRATNVPFTVTHQGISTKVVENQQLNNNAWVLLGTFALTAGTSSSVTVSNTGTNGYVIADAVRFVPAGASAVLSGTTLNVNGTGAADNMTLSDDGTTITLVLDGVTSTFADSAVSKIVVNPSAGGDTVNLLSNTKPVSITGGGLDTVNIGDGSVQKIAAAVSVDNPTSFTNLTINGSTDSGAATLTASTLSGFSPGAITYNAGRLSTLTIIVGGTISVNNTGVLHNNAATFIDGPATVLGTTGPLTVSLLNGGTAFVGQGSVQDIKGALIIEQDEATGSSLYIDDSNDPVGRNVLVSNFATITGLAPAPIIYQGADSGAEMGIGLGNGNDTLTIDGGAYPVANYDLGGGDDLVNLIASTLESTITGGAGNDTLHLNTADGLSDFATFDGGIGTNSVVVDDNSDPFGQPYVLGTGGVGDIDGSVIFQNIQMISLLGGPSNNNITGGSSPTIPALIHGGAGDDIINGGSGNDTIFGDAGNDTINGGSGNDSLNGGPGTDVLNGGTGIDTLDQGDGQPIQIIADNIANAPVNGSQGVTLTGNWISSTSTPGFYGTDYINDNNSLKGTKSVQFTPNIPTAGVYQVYARWTAAANRATNVPFSVTHQGITSTVIENQQINNNAWVLLGTYTLNAGTGSSVTISNTGTNGYVIADAVRFVPAVATASISGVVFNDANGNGVQDSGEGGVAGRVVYIDSNKDGILDNGEPSTITDAGGNWSFTGLAAGTYRIREQNVAGVRHTDPPGSANYYDATVVTGPTASAIYGTRFGEQEMTARPAPVLAINAGGPTFVLNSGFTYAADNGFAGGAAATTVFDVANTDNDPIYYSYRSGSSFSYSLAVPNGTYSLVLNFVDPTKTAAGQREFNVTVEGKQVLTNFDIVANAGPKTAVSKAFTVTVTGGTLTLSFKSVVDNAILSGIALYPT